MVMNIQIPQEGKPTSLVTLSFLWRIPLIIQWYMVGWFQESYKICGRAQY